MFGFTVYENTIYYALVMADYYHWIAINDIDNVQGWNMTPGDWWFSESLQ